MRREVDARRALSRKLANLRREAAQALMRGDFETARAKWEELLKLSEEAGKPTDTGVILVQLGDLWLRQRKYDEAQGQYEKALTICGKVISAEPEAQDAREGSRRRADAARFRQYERARLINLRRNSLMGLSQCHRGRGDPRAALRSAKAMLELDRQGDKPHLISGDMHYIASLYQELGQHAEARRYFEAARQSASAGPGARETSGAGPSFRPLPVQIQAVMNIASSHLQDGDQKAADAAFRRAVKLLAKLEASDSVRAPGGSTLSAPQQVSNLLLRASMSLQIASAYLQMDKTAPALACARRALDAASQASDIAGGQTEMQSSVALRKASCLLAMARVQVAMGEFKKALDYLAQVPATLKPVEKERRIDLVGPTFETALIRADAFEGMRAYDDALRSRMEVVRVTNDLPNRSAQWLFLADVGRLLESMRRSDEAERHYADSIRAIESLRGRLRLQEDQASFVENKVYAYEALAKLLLDLSRPADALHTIERVKARNLLAFLANKRLRPQSTQVAELLRQEEKLARQIAELEQRPSPPSSAEATHRGPAGVMALARPLDPEQQKKLSALKEQYDALLEHIRTSNAELADFITVAPPHPDDVQRLLSDDEVVVEYYLGRRKMPQRQGVFFLEGVVTGRENCFAFVLTNGGVRARRLEAAPQEVMERVEEFRSRIASASTETGNARGDYRELARELYDMLIAPVAPWIGQKTTLVFVPHRTLHYLPFHALITPRGKFLVEERPVAYLPSVSALKYIRSKNRHNRGSLLALGNPKTDLPPLPASEREVSQIARLFSARKVLVGAEATEAAAKRLAPRYDILLFSTHGQLYGDNPLKSNLRLTAGAGSDGRLTVDEVFDLPLRANLVALSACETGLSVGPRTTKKFPSGDDLVGLSRAFLYAGTPSVLASLWPVPDLSTAELMTAFFREFKAGASKAVALRKAQLAMLHAKSTAAGDRRGAAGVEATAHPYSWAPFVVIGDWR